MPARRFFQRFRRRGRPPWHLLPEDAVLVVNLPDGMQVDNDIFCPFGAVIPRERFQERQLRALYDWRRIEVKAAPTQQPEPEPEPEPEPLLGVAINSRGPVKAPVRRETHPAR